MPVDWVFACLKVWVCPIEKMRPPIVESVGKQKNDRATESAVA